MTNKVLIVEDDFIIQMFFEMVVQQFGWEIVGVVSSGNECIAQIELQAPNIILMDIGIAGKLNGIETAKLIRDQHQIPVVFVTGNSDQKTMEKTKEVNPLHVIFKPIDADSLISELKHIESLLPQ